MKKNLVSKIIIALLLVTAVLATVHLATRLPEETGAIQIIYNGKMVSVSLPQLPLQDISTTVINGKGEEKAIEGKGIPLSAVLDQAGVDLTATQQVKVVAADEFSACLTVQETMEDGRAYLMQEDSEERPRLVVVGDPDSKRRVKGVTRIEVE